MTALSYRSKKILLINHENRTVEKASLQFYESLFTWMQKPGLPYWPFILGNFHGRDRAQDSSVKSEKQNADEARGMAPCFIGKKTTNT
ncbi:hypothetical protein [Noviherbaspirillum malthae]|uniref:hypothetical protein n=1 Tax=Noviherbaspirillum malthae TaxID=1260987 RepID=UPI001890256A|nr:hypothetical protein [Noviherbaspirillum malthae]